MLLPIVTDTEPMALAGPESGNGTLNGAAFNPLFCSSIPFSLFSENASYTKCSTLSGLTVEIRILRSANAPQFPFDSVAVPICGAMFPRAPIAATNQVHLPHRCSSKENSHPVNLPSARLTLSSTFV